MDLIQPLWWDLPSVEPRYCSTGVRVPLRGMISLTTNFFDALTNLLVGVDMTAVSPRMPISTASLRRTPAPAHSKTAATTLLIVSGSACHGRAPSMEAATMKTPCSMTCLAHRRRSALVPGQELVRAVLAVRLMSPRHLEVKMASRSSRSLASRARWRSKPLNVQINGLTSFDTEHFRAQRHFLYVF